MRIVFLVLVVFTKLPCCPVPIDLYVLAETDGSWQVIEPDSFLPVLREVNGVFSQVAMEFEVRSCTVVSNHEWMVLESESEFLDILDTCPSTNGIPMYVVDSISGSGCGWSLKDEGCCVEARSGWIVFAHELGHMCGLSDIYPCAENDSDPERPVEISVQDDEASESLQPMDWGRYPSGTTQGDLINRMLMNGYYYSNTANGVDITAGDVYGVCIGTVTNATTGEVTHPYVKGMAGVGFLLHGDRNPSRKVRAEE